MNIRRFEGQMTRIIPSFAGFTEWTASIPKLYWNVKSQEQRILAICKMLDKVICYADMLGENVDEIAKTLQDILDGKLDEEIQAAILTWFEDNEPEIMADIEALQQSVSDLSDIIGEGFTSENTIADAISANTDAIGANADAILVNAGAISDEVTARVNDVDDEERARIAADEDLQEQIDYNRSFIDEVDVRSFVTPMRKGIIRCATHQYDDSTPNETRIWAQGFCIHNGIMTQVEFNTSGDYNSALYQRAESDTTWGAPVYANIRHGHSIIYYPDNNHYYVGTAAVNEVVELDSALVRSDVFMLGNHPDYGVLLAYDKVTGVLYGSHYGDDLFTWNATTKEITEYLPQWSEFLTKDEGSLQDIAAYNGFLYVLYSSTGRIDKWRISDCQYICSYTFANKQGTYFIGECEGIDVDESGRVWFSSTTKFNDAYSYQYTYINMFDPDNPQNSIDDWKTSIAGTTKTVCSATAANLLGCQHADGSGANPYPTINEAIFDIMLQPQQYTTISIGGEHSDEPIVLYLDNIRISGWSDDKPNVGQITTRAARTTIENVNIAPKVDVNYHIYGYRSGLVQYNSSNVTFVGTPTSGYNALSQGILQTSIPNETA